MDPQAIGVLLEKTLAVVFAMSAPVLFVGLAIGVVISVVQAATQINEVTLVFIPKMLGAGLALWVTGPWLFEQISQLVHEISIHMSQVAGVGL